MAKGTKFQSIAGIINETSTLIKTFLGKIGEAVKNNQAIKDFVNSLATNLERLQDKIKNLTPEQVDKLVTAFVKFAKAGVELLVFGKIISGLGKLTSVAGSLVNTFSTVSGAMKIFSGATTSGTAGMQMLAKAFTFITGPAGIVIGIITAIIALMVILYKNSETFRNTVNEAFSEIKGALTELWNAIKPSLEQLWSSLKELIKALEPIFTILVKVLAIVIKSASTVLQVVIPIISKVISFIVSLVTVIVQVMVDIQTKVIKFFTQTIPNAFMNFINTVANFVKSIINWFKQLPSKILTIINNVISVIKSLPQNMLNIGKNIVEGLWNGIKNAGNWIKNKVKEFAKGILDGMKSALGIHSPSTLFRDQVGKYIALGVGEGFEDNIKKVYRQMKTAVDFETQKLSANLSTQATFGRTLNANITLEGSDIYMDSQKVGRAVTPTVSRTLQVGGAY